MPARYAPARMCGRFTLTERDLAKLARGFLADLNPALAAEWHPRYNVAPGSAHLLLRDAGGTLRLERARFGFGAREQLRINARVETAAERRTFREAWTSRRCAIPADGFYEWGGPARDRRPTWFHDPAGRPLLLAGLWGEAHGGALAFAILTTAANEPVAALHDRMPVLLPEGGLAPWLAGGDPPGPAREGALVGRPVSARVNGIAHDDAACLEPPPPERQLRLL